MERGGRRIFAFVQLPGIGPSIEFRNRASVEAGVMIRGLGDGAAVLTERFLTRVRELVAEAQLPAGEW